MATQWDTTRSVYQPRLEHLQAALVQLERLISLQPTLLDPDRRERLREISTGVQRQLSKLRVDEFHIAVVGLEKAGKSTFLNAWMKAEILPNSDKRCTYTSTEIRSLEQGQDARISIEFYTREEMDRLESQYSSIAAGKGVEADNAATDLEELDEHRATINQYLDRPAETISFNDSSEVLRLLEPFVANPATARAVKTVRVFTHELVDERGIVFHDVPGYDSPITLHKGQARRELERADAVIFLTNISAGVSLRENQLQILRDIKDREDSSVAVKDKVFFFLNKADKANGKSDLEGRIRSAHEEIVDRYGVCLRERVLVGSAAVHLLTTSQYITPKTRGLLGSIASDYEKKYEPPHGDGMEALKGQINDYLSTDRAAILKRRCDSYLDDGKALIDEALELSRQRHPGNLDNLDAELADSALDHFVNWFDDRWYEFERSFEKYWQTEIQPLQDLDQLTPGKHTSILELEERYLSLVDKLSETSLLSNSKLEETFRRARKGVPLPETANAEARRILVDQNLMPTMDVLTRDVSALIYEVIDTVRAWVQEYFYGIEAIGAELVPSGGVSIHKALIEHGLAALLLRYARPAAEIFLRTQRGGQGRLNMREGYHQEITLLGLYYGGEDRSRANLDAYIHTGRWYSLDELRQVETEPVQKEEKTQRVHRGILSAHQREENRANSEVKRAPALDGLEVARQARDFQEVEAEIREDSAAFIDYLKHSVFHAASFDQFAHQELMRVHDHILSDETRRKVRSVIKRAHSSGNARLRGELDNAAQDAERLRQILAARARLETERTRV